MFYWFLIIWKSTLGTPGLSAPRMKIIKHCSRYSGHFSLFDRLALAGFLGCFSFYSSYLKTNNVTREICLISNNQLRDINSARLYSKYSVKSQIPHFVIWNIGVTNIIGAMFSYFLVLLLAFSRYCSRYSERFFKSFLLSCYTLLNSSKRTDTPFTHRKRERRSDAQNISLRNFCNVPWFCDSERREVILVGKGAMDPVASLTGNPSPNTHRGYTSGMNIWRGIPNMVSRCVVTPGLLNCPPFRPPGAL